MPNQMTPVARPAQGRVPEAEQRVSGGRTAGLSWPTDPPPRWPFARLAVLTALCSTGLVHARRGRRAPHQTGRPGHQPFECHCRSLVCHRGVVGDTGDLDLAWAGGVASPHLPHVSGDHVLSRPGLAPERRPGIVRGGHLVTVAYVVAHPGLCGGAERWIPKTAFPGKGS